MICIKEKNAGNAIAFTRLFDAETGHIAPILEDSTQFPRIVVEISSFTGSKLRQLRLNSENLGSCAVQFPISFRP